MDFLVVGLGLGALSILSGIVMVTLVVWRSRRAAQRAALPEEQRYLVATATSRNAAGQAQIAAGIVILLATIGAVAGSLDDRTGSLLVATTATVAALGLIVRDFLYRSRNPIPRRTRAGPLEAPVAASPTRTAPLAMAPIAAAPRSTNQEQEEGPEPDEAMVAMSEDPALDAAPDPRALVEIDAAIPDAELDNVPDESEANLVAATDTDAVIDVPYSFMREGDPAAGERTAPYSFMAADNPPEGSEEASSRNRNGARSGSDPPDADLPRKAKPSLRLVGKQRAQTR